MSVRTSLAIALSLSLGISAAAASTPASLPSPTLVVVHHTWQPHEREGARVLDWIAAHWPERAPVGTQGVVTVETVKRLPRNHSSARDTPSPPGGLPEKGVPGEEYNVENTLPDGTVQTWSFRWVEPSTGHGGSWDMVGYSYRKGNDPINVQ